MSVLPRNLLFIFSDEHNLRLMSGLGHPFVKTPNLDRLAARGTRFTNAVTPSPICVPARAALATGLPLHRMEKFFDNGDPYEGSIPSWHHVLRENGHTCVSIGKLHFRGLPEDDHGFSEEQIPMHVVDNKGDLLALIRDHGKSPKRMGAGKMAGSAGPGESDYTRYDRDITALAQAWLHDEAPKQKKPWCLFVSIVTPHFPLTCPPEYYYRYLDMDLPLPKSHDPSEWPDHPAIQEYRRVMAYGDHIPDLAKLKSMMAGYYGLCSFMDEQVGKLLDCLESTGLAASTRVLYTSDHGDSVGARGLWGKSVMYQESVGIPMILAGEGVEAGKLVDTPVNLTDMFATVTEAVGCKVAPPEGSLSLFQIARQPIPDRVVLSEYHATGSSEAAYMLRDHRWKYIRHVTFPPQLFDLEADPEELTDLGTDPAYANLVAKMEARLREILDPEAVDRMAKARQAHLIEVNGGRDAVLARGDLPFSPPPGVKASWS